MKEDILEQIVDQYLNLKGYFTVANVRYKPLPGDKGYVSRDDSVTSDIDVVGFNPLIRGAERVIAVSCKSWQAGFDTARELELIQDPAHSAKKRWRTHRELADDKWALAFRRKIEELTGETEFEYWTACVRLKDKDKAALWTGNSDFQQRLTPFLRIVDLHQMFSHIHGSLTTTPAGSDLGRMIQVMKAAGMLKEFRV